MNDNLQTARDKAMDKIRKLLAMANDGRGNEQEAATAARQAEKMMRQYQIDTAEVVMQELETEEAFGQGMGQVSFENIKGHKPKQVPGWVGIIAIGCGSAFTTKVDVVRTANGIMVRFSGYKMDVELCKWVYHFLCETVMRVSREQTTGMAGAKSFRAGAAGALQRRLFAMKMERQQENEAYDAQHKALTNKGPGTAVALFDRKAERVEEMFGAQETKQKKTKVSDADAYHAGRVAGSKMNIPTNRPVGGAPARTAIK